MISQRLQAGYTTFQHGTDGSLNGNNVRYMHMKALKKVMEAHTHRSGAVVCNQYLL
jgi:hypothetical protein